LLCLLALGGISIFHDYNQMWDDRAEKLRSIDDAAVSLAAELDRRVQAGALTQEQAIEQFRNTIRFDGGSGYYVAYAMDGRTLVLGPTPSVEGTNRINLTDADGELFIQAQIAAAQRGGGAVVYNYPKPGEKVAQPKLSYVVPFKPWTLYVGTGAYVDDLRAAAFASAEQLVGVIAVLLGITVMVAWLVSRGITRPLGRLRQSMTALADGHLTGVIAGGERRDEMGDMARAVVVFQQHMAMESERAAEQATEREQAAQEKRTGAGQHGGDDRAGDQPGAATDFGDDDRDDHNRERDEQLGDAHRHLGAECGDRGEPGAGERADGGERSRTAFRVDPRNWRPGRSVIGGGCPRGRGR
jgi:methyl-accepting chemotaxis protein